VLAILSGVPVRPDVDGPTSSGAMPVRPDRPSSRVNVVG